jgi:hypothetical protein
MNNQSRPKGGLLVSLGQYGAWFVACVLILLDVLYVFEAFESVLAAIQGAQQASFIQSGGIGLDFQVFYVLSALDNVVLLVLAVLAVAGAITIEYYFRKGQPKGLLLKRIGIVFGIEIAILVVSVLIRNIV